jgi:hypothetical protein
MKEAMPMYRASLMVLLRANGKAIDSKPSRCYVRLIENTEE